MPPSAQYVFETFKAQVLDMESAAVATVAYANGVPFIAFRSLSDLAGGNAAATSCRSFSSSRPTIRPPSCSSS